MKHRGVVLVRPGLAIAVAALSLIPLLAACDRGGTHADGIDDPGVPDHLTEAVQTQWSQLVEDLAMERRSTGELTAYQLDPTCPLIYDFAFRWPLRDGLANDSLGRLELRQSADGMPRVEVHNRATGVYPVYRGEHYPGTERWRDEIEPVTGRLTEQGLIADKSWPAIWTMPGVALGPAAFFPPLPAPGLPASWELSRSAQQTAEDGIAAAAEVEIAAYLTVDGHPATVLEARLSPHQGTPDFLGRYLVDEMGRLLAAIWATSTPDGRAAVGSARLTGACGGMTLSPLPIVTSANRQ